MKRIFLSILIGTFFLPFFEMVYTGDHGIDDGGMQIITVVLKENYHIIKEHKNLFDSLTDAFPLTLSQDDVFTSYNEELSHASLDSIKQTSSASQELQYNYEITVKQSLGDSNTYCLSLSLQNVQGTQGNECMMWKPADTSHEV